MSYYKDQYLDFKHKAYCKEITYDEDGEESFVILHELLNFVPVRSILLNANGDTKIAREWYLPERGRDTWDGMTAHVRYTKDLMKDHCAFIYISEDEAFVELL